MRVSLASTIVFVLLISEPNVHAQPADSPWPMFQGNAAHTGRSIYRASDTGALAWSYLTGDSIYSSPVIDQNGIVYAGSCDNSMYAFSPTGSISWSYSSAGRFMSGSALGANGLLYTGSIDNNFYAFTGSGSLAWSYLLGAGVVSPPSIDPEGMVYTGCYDRNLYSFDQAGIFSWSYLTGSPIVCPPAVGTDGHIYTGSWDNNLYALEHEGRLIWSYAIGDEYSGVSIGSDGRLYSGSTDNYAFCVAPGGALAWSYLTSDDVLATPALGPQGQVYFGCADKNIFALSSSGALLWTYTTGGYLASSAALGCNGLIYVASYDNNFYALNSTGSLLWSYYANVAGTYDYGSSAIGSDGRVYTGSPRDKRLYAFAGPPPNYVNLSVSPPTIAPGVPITIAYQCDFNTWDYRNREFDVFLVAVRNPVVWDGPSTVADVLAGGEVYIFKKNMSGVYLFKGTVDKPTFSRVTIPPVPTSALLMLVAPPVPGFSGQWSFGLAFFYTKDGAVRSDLPVEMSNLIRLL